MRRLTLPHTWLTIGIMSYLSGYLITYAFAPYAWWPLAMLSPFLLLALWERFATHRLWVTISYGMGYFTAGAWIFISLYEHAHVSFLLSLLATGLFIIGCSMSFLFVYLGTHKLPGPPTIKVMLYFPLSWALMEYSRTLSSLAYPWLLLPYSQTAGPFMTLSPWIGVYGMSIMLTLIVGCSYLAISRRHTRFLLPIFVICGLLAYSHHQHTKPIQNKQVQVLMLQPLTPEADKWHEKSISALIAHYDKLLKQHIKDHSLVIFPESAIPYVPASAESNFHDMLDQLHQHQAGAIIGSFDHTPGATYNSAIGLGAVHGHIHKHRLVAFGETTPDIPFLHDIATYFAFPMSTLQPAETTPANFDFANKQLATFICYEIAFPDEVISRARDADIIIVISDNIWFGTSNASYQHRQIAQFYATMLKKPTFFVNNSGLSAIIDAEGNIVQTLTNQRAGFMDYQLDF
jgi:apolipoprotein N-acyltransferase